MPRLATPLMRITLLLGCLALASGVAGEPQDVQEAPETGPETEDGPAFTYPDSPAGRVARAYVEAFNSGDAELMEAFTLEHRSADALEGRSMEERLAGWRQAVSMLGTLEPRSVLEDEPYAITLHVFSAQMNGWLSAQLGLQPEPPHKLTTISMRPAPGPEVIGISYEGWTDLATLAERVRDDLDMPGFAVALADGERIREVAVTGVRMHGADDAVAANDVFHIGSVTKSMTATVVGAMVAKGMLDWETSLSTALPDVAMREAYKEVTIVELLQHRGGIPAHLTFNDAEMTRLVGLPGTPTEQRATFVAEVLAQPSIGPSGGASRYSNAGYIIAGYIAERTAGKPWETLMREYVFEPCAMTTAGIGWPATATRPDQPRGHYGEGDATRAQGLEEYDLGAFTGPAGDVHCSAADLARYGQAHLQALRKEGGPLDAGVVARLHAPLVEDAGMPYACGWAIRRTKDGHAMHWHNGSAGTFYASLSIYPEANLVVAVVANRMSMSCDEVVDRMNEAILARARD